MTDDLETLFRSVLSAPQGKDLPKACADAVRPLISASTACIDDAIALLPALAASDMAQAALIEQCQHLLSDYLRPGGLSKRDVLDRLLGLLDGPEQREVLALHERAVRLMKGETE